MKVSNLLKLSFCCISGLIMGLTLNRSQNGFHLLSVCTKESVDSVLSKPYKIYDFYGLNHSVKLDGNYVGAYIDHLEIQCIEGKAK
jgi:hypothetical protein